MLSPSPATAAGPVHLRRVSSPIGRIELTGDGNALLSVSIERAGTLPLEQEPQASDELLDEAARQLDQYFDGSRREFELPISLRGTPFQLAVWQRLAELPFGTAISYGQLGSVTGRATAGRAVGGAVGANPVPIIVPCHRVLAGNGRVTGYSGGNGIVTKLWLLDHEGIAYR